MPAPIRIYHHAGCSKSRAACALLAEAGAEMEVVDYLSTPPTAEDLRELLRKLGLGAVDLLRRGEPVYREIYGVRDLGEGEAFEALLTHPILLERPIVVSGDRAVVARPPERVKELFPIGAGPAE